MLQKSCRILGADSTFDQREEFPFYMMLQKSCRILGANSTFDQREKFPEIETPTKASWIIQADRTWVWRPWFPMSIMPRRQDNAAKWHGKQLLQPQGKGTSEAMAAAALGKDSSLWAFLWVAIETEILLAVQCELCCVAPSFYRFPGLRCLHLLPFSKFSFMSCTCQRWPMGSCPMWDAASLRFSISCEVTRADLLCAVLCSRHMQSACDLFRELFQGVGVYQGGGNNGGATWWGEKGIFLAR
jgi:hypothetical protein